MSIKIAVGINSLVCSQHAAYSNHLQFFYKLGRKYKDEIEFCLINPNRMPIDRMRNMAAEYSLFNEFDYLLFLDDDVLVPLDCMDKLIHCMKFADIAAGDVCIRSYPFNHMAFRYVDKHNMLAIEDWPEGESTIAEVDAVGFSLCLIKVELLKKVPQPFFITGVTNTEDIYFCLKAKKHVADCNIVVDRSIDCGHILWNEVISQENRTLYKEYFQKQYSPAGKETTGKEIDRGDSYLKSVEEVLKNGGAYGKDS